MANGVSVVGQLSGLAAYNAKLAALQSEVEDSTRQTNAELAASTANDMRSRVPTEGRSRGGYATGQLESTIRTEKADDDTTTVEVGVEGETEYLGFVEFGSAHAAAQPFVRPAVAKAEADLDRLQTQAAQKRVGKLVEGP